MALIEMVILTDISCSIHDDFKTDIRNVDLEYANIRTRKIRHTRTIHSRRQIIDRILQQIERIVHTYSGYEDRSVEEQQLDKIADHRTAQEYRYDYLQFFIEMMHKRLQGTRVPDTFRRSLIRYPEYLASDLLIRLKTTGQMAEFMFQGIAGRIESKEWNQPMAFSPHFG